MMRRRALATTAPAHPDELCGLSRGRRHHV